MKIDKLKVRPRKAAATAPCATEFAAMLACWASSHDLRSQGECREAARALQTCMTTAVSSMLTSAQIAARQSRRSTTTSHATRSVSKTCTWQRCLGVHDCVSVKPSRRAEVLAPVSYEKPCHWCTVSPTSVARQCTASMAAYYAPPASTFARRASACISGRPPHT